MSEKKVQIICPICSKSKRIGIPVDVVKKKESGATSVFIPSDMICKHEFYVYIDRNFKVRDYLKLEFNLQDEARKTEELKSSIIRKSSEYILEMDNILSFISEKDLRTLFFAGFIESPIILIEKNTDSERFGVIFNILAKIFPNMVEGCNIFSPKKYLEFSENHKEQLEGITVYNVVYKLVLHKPFLNDESMPMEELISIIKKGSFKLQIIYAKNFVDYIHKFAEEIKNLDENRNDKLVKYLKKRNDKHQEYITKDFIKVMKKRNKFQKFHLKTGEDTKEGTIKKLNEIFSGTLFMYNAKTHIRQAERLPTLTGKLTLQLLRHNKAMTIDKITNELKIKEREMVIQINYSEIENLLESFVKNDFIEKL